MPALTPFILGLIVIVVSTALARRLGVASPLVLVGIGLVTSWLPFVPPIEIDPEWILVGILPPLLYAAAIRLPAIEFRRDARPVSGLAVILVVLSSLALGALFYAAVPSLGFALAVAIGAILSPTDAVATSIVKKLGIAPRVVTMLEGESLLNDATALVLLRSAVAAAAAGFSFWGTVGTFVWGVVAAIIVGLLVGFVNLRVREWIANPAANTALGFVVPFLAYFPTEQLGGSGLVAAVVAGITTGQGAARRFTPEQRLSDELNWRTVELVLESAVFLVMGLELRELVTANLERQHGLGLAIALALAALGIVVVVRAAYVTGLVWIQQRRARGRRRERVEALGEKLEGLSPGRRVDSLRSRLTRTLHDLDYYQSAPLGWKHGTVIVWAGMRGVVTLAAAQTLPRETPARELLILTAFLVAVISLMVQGLTLPWVIRLLRMPASTETPSRTEQARLHDELRAAALVRLNDPRLAKQSGEPFDPELISRIGAKLSEPPQEDASEAIRDVRELRLALIEAMRERLIEVGRERGFSTATLRHALAELDADQLGIEVRRDGE